MQFNARALGLLKNPKEFADIIIRSNPDGSQVKIKDVARVELGAQTYDLRGRFNQSGKQSASAALGVFLAPGANAIETADNVKKILEDAKSRFPPDMAYDVVMDSTLPIKASMESIVGNTEGVRSALGLAGYNVLNSLNFPNSAMMFVGLEPWEERKSPALHAKALVADWNKKFAAIPGARAFACGPPPLPGYGNVSGFTMQLQDRSSGSIEQLAGYVQQPQKAVAERPEIARVSTTFNPATPQVKVELDREKARTLGAPVDSIFQTLQTYLSGLYVNVYAQIGLVMLIGLSAKNAILIVEFAKMKREEGVDILEAAIQGSKLRLRPILMTSFAFSLGCVPLMVARGSGAASRSTMGTGVVYGMTIATVVGLFIIPVCHVFVQKLVERGGKKKAAEAAPVVVAEPKAGGAHL